MKNFFKSILSLIILSTVLLTAQEKVIFRAAAEMEEERYGFGSATDGNFLYAICGGTGFYPYYSAEVERYDPATDKWSVLAKTSTLRRYLNAEYVPSQNKIYIMNGEYFTSSFSSISKRIEVLDLKTNSVSLCAENPNPVKNAGSAVWNNKIYIFGGQNLYGYSNDFYEYDPVNDSWKKLPDLPERFQTSGKIVDGNLYVFGGYNGRRSFESVYMYNIDEAKWTKLDDLPFYISANAAAAEGKKIWLVGSYLDTDLLAVYDTETKSVIKMKSNMVSRRHAGAQVLGNCLFIFGGNQNANALSSLSNAEFTDLSTLIKR